MKVLHVFKTYLPEDFTGIPQVIHAIAEGLADRGVESHVLALYRDVEAVPDSIGRHHVHAAKLDLHVASTGLSYSVFGKFHGLLKNADIVHYHFPWPMADLLHLAFARAKPSLVTYHSDIVKQRRLLRLYEPLMHRFLSRVDAIVATSPPYARTSTVLARHRSKVSVIPLGIAERTPPSAESIAKWRERVGEDFFLFVGSLRYYKGIRFLVEAARRTGLPLVIVGDNRAGDLDASNLPANVKYVGVVDSADKEALLDLSRAVVLPSHLRSEAFGVSLLEAARAGKPMISCEIGTGTSYVNIDGQTGRVIPPADASAIAGAMQQLVTRPEYAAELGRNARARYLAMFQADDVATGYLQLYERLLNRSRT